MLIYTHYLHCILFTLICINNEILPGFCQKTLLETIHGSVSLSNIKFNDSVWSYDFETNESTILPVKQIFSYKTLHTVKITVDTHTIYAVQDQLFFDAAIEEFIPAKQISDRTVFLSKTGKLYQCCKAEIVEEEHKVTTIILDDPHIFFVSELQLMAHNCDVGACIYSALSEWVHGILGIACLSTQGELMYAKDQAEFVKYVLETQSKFTTETYEHFMLYKDFPEFLKRPSRNLLPGEPPTLYGIQIQANDYLDMIQNPYRYGPYCLTGEMINDGLVKTTLHRLYFILADEKHNVYEWRSLGSTLLDRSDAIVKHFLQAEDEKQLTNLKDYLKTVPEDLKKELFISENIFQEASDLKSRFGCFDKEIYGRKFGIHALYNMVQKYLPPSQVLEITRNHRIYPTKHKNHTLYWHKYNRKLVLTENFSQKIVAIGYDRDDIHLFSESAEIIEKENTVQSEKEESSNEADNSKDDESKTKEKTPKTIEDLTKEAKPGDKTKGKSKQYEKQGGFEEALEDFESLKLINLREIPNGKAGNLLDGRTVNVRTGSTDKRPTLEIYNPKNKNSIKIRYGDKL